MFKYEHVTQYSNFKPLTKTICSQRPLRNNWIQTKQKNSNFFIADVTATRFCFKADISCSLSPFRNTQDKRYFSPVNWYFMPAICQHTVWQTSIVFETIILYSNAKTEKQNVSKRAVSPKNHYDTNACIYCTGRWPFTIVTIIIIIIIIINHPVLLS